MGQRRNVRALVGICEFRLSYFIETVIPEMSAYFDQGLVPG